MKIPLFPKDGSNKSDNSGSDVRNFESLVERMEAAARSADVAVKKAEMTAIKAEAAATRAEVLVKQVQAMLEEISRHSVDTANSPAPRVWQGRETAVDIPEVEDASMAPRTVSESGIPLVAPFIVQ